MKLIAVLFLVFVSCTNSNHQTKNELNIALSSDVSTLDPAVSYDTVSAKVVYQVYESLYQYDYLMRPYQLIPALAQGQPKISEDKLTYTIKIKPNVFYHEHKAFQNTSRAVKSIDFINQIKRLAFKGTRSNGWWLLDGKIKGLNEFRKNAKPDFSNFYSLNITGLSAPDDSTLVIKLTKPYPQLQYALAMSFTTPIPKEIIDFYSNDLTHFAVGTGPFKFVNWEKNLKIKLIKNQNYRLETFPSKGDRHANENKLLVDAKKPMPFIGAINFSIMKEAQTRWLNFRKKKIDIIILTKDHFSLALDNSGKLNEEFKKDNIKLQIAPTLTYWWLAFNMKHPLLGKNLKLRKAMAHAIDIDRYIKDFTNNIALKANSIYPPGVIGYSPSYELPYKYDLDKAKKILADAGYPGGEGLPVFEYDVRGSTTVSRQMGEFIAKELSNIGIKIKVNLNTFPGFLHKAKTGQLEMWQGGWAMDYPDPENTIQLLTTKNHPPGPNASYYSNNKVDVLYQQLFGLNSKKDVLKITQEVQEQVANDIPWVMQYYSRNYILYHGHIHNYRESDIIVNNYKYLRIEAK